jgi:hypothetical protein
LNWNTEAHSALVSANIRLEALINLDGWCRLEIVAGSFRCLPFFEREFVRNPLGFWISRVDVGILAELALNDELSLLAKEPAATRVTMSAVSALRSQF